MGESTMRWMALVLLTTAFACAQQDEDVAAAARANLQQKQKQTTPAKVYTNDDLGSTAPARAKEPSGAGDSDIGQLARNKQEKAKQIIRQILQQRERIAELEAHLDKLQQIESERGKLETPPPLSARDCANEPERCETFRAFAADLGRTQKQLAVAQEKLDDMQDSARKAGYPPSVFDP